MLILILADLAAVLILAFAVFHDGKAQKAEYEKWIGPRKKKVTIRIPLRLVVKNVQKPLPAGGARHRYLHP